jgi:anhydro-N-acetylmuramic acid kinase
MVSERLPDPAQEPELCVGLMSGTSLDGADAVLADCAGLQPRVIAHAYQPFSTRVRDDLLGLQAGGVDELHRAALAANALADHYADLVRTVLAKADVRASAVRAIGAHGQTVRHRPELGYSWQLNAPARLAELCGIDVIADFRSRDIAAGGQGAPLVPALHARLFGQPSRERAVLNLGGIANLTQLPSLASTQAVRGWDCGPGNVLLDHWAAQNGQGRFDENGQWAQSGVVIDALLASLLREPWLARTPPKSTGRDLFNGAWLERHLGEARASPAQDVQATLAEFTARIVGESVSREMPRSESIVVCGGGARNRDLLARIARNLDALMGHAVELQTSEALGIDPEHVEALAFAWLAHQFLLGAPGNLPAVTGARGQRILGALYPANVRTAAQQALR